MGVRRFFFSLIFVVTLFLLIFFSSRGPNLILMTSSGSHFFDIEIVDELFEQRQGLMYRSSLSAKSGMLFVYPDLAPRTFWMKNTFIPLDMIFFDAKKRVVDIKENIPPCKEDPCSFYSSVAPAQYVLELNGGIADRIRLHIGDFFQLLR